MDVKKELETTPQHRGKKQKQESRANEFREIQVVSIGNKIIELGPLIRPQPVNDERNIPPYDASATTPQEAYPLKKIIEEKEWDFLQDIYRLLQHEDVAPTDDYPVFVRNRLHKLQLIESDSQKKTLCAASSLLTHLVKFKDLYSTDGVASAVGHKFPGIIIKKCFSFFMDPFPKTNEISVDKTNLLISYVLVLALYVDNFKTDPKDIAKDLRISLTDLKKHFQSLACKLSWDKNVVVATLPTPLNFLIKSKLKRKRTHKGGRR